MAKIGYASAHHSYANPGHAYAKTYLSYAKADHADGVGDFAGTRPVEGGAALVVSC